MLHILKFLAPLIFCVLGFAASSPLFAQQGYVHEVSGNVTGQVGPGQPATVEKGQTLPNGSTITTGPKSYAVLKFEDGTVVLLKENTAFQVQSYSFQPKAPENANAIFNLVRGGLRLITGTVTSRNRDALRVATPLATIGIRGTEFTAELTNPLFLAVQVGAASLTNAAGTLVVGAGQFASVASAAQLGSLISAAQLPAGVLQMPKIALPPATPATPPPGAAPIGAGAAAPAAGTAAIVGGAAAAGVAATGTEATTTTHHPP